MIYQAVIHNHKLKEENCHVTSCRNRSSFSESIFSFNDGLLRAIIDAFRFCPWFQDFTRSLIGAVNKTFHVNVCVGLLFKCLDGSDTLLMSECSSHRISTFLFVSPDGKIWSCSSLDFLLNLSLNCFMTPLINQNG